MDASPGIQWVGSRIAVCGACPAFTHVPARMVADRLCGPFGPGAPHHVVASMIRPDCHHPKRQLLGGVRTRQGNAPFHGAPMPSGYRHLTRHDRCRIQARGKRSFAACHRGRDRPLAAHREPRDFAQLRAARPSPRPGRRTGRRFRSILISGGARRRPRASWRLRGGRG